jgi:hypothetical protein
MNGSRGGTMNHGVSEGGVDGARRHGRPSAFAGARSAHVAVLPRQRFHLTTTAPGVNTPQSKQNSLPSGSAITM